MYFTILCVPINGFHLDIFRFNSNKCNVMSSTLRINFRSFKESVIRFILLRDVPVCSASSVCLIDGLIIKSNITGSFEVHSKVSIWHFDASALALWIFVSKIPCSSSNSPKYQFDTLESHS